jgi:hypothetical protein
MGIRVNWANQLILNFDLENSALIFSKKAKYTEGSLFIATENLNALKFGFLKFFPNTSIKRILFRPTFAAKKVVN